MVVMVTMINDIHQQSHGLFAFSLQMVYNGIKVFGDMKMFEYIIVILTAALAGNTARMTLEVFMVLWYDFGRKN